MNAARRTSELRIGDPPTAARSGHGGASCQGSVRECWVEGAFSERTRLKTRFGKGFSLRHKEAAGSELEAELGGGVREDVGSYRGGAPSRGKGEGARGVKGQLGQC